MIVYLLGPARFFSKFAQIVVHAGGIPIGAPLFAALSDAQARSCRHELLAKADLVYCMSFWRDEYAAIDDYLEAQQHGKVITADLPQLRHLLSEEVLEAELEYLDIGPAGTRLLGSQLGLQS